MINADEKRIAFALDSRLEALTDKGPPHATQWTPEMDAMLLKYWNSGKRKADVAEVLGVCENTARTRFYKITSVRDK